MAEFGEQLRKAREEKGFTQQSLAEKVYVARQTVSRWESGDRYPDLVTLRKLSSVLGVSTDELLSNDEVPEVIEKTPIIEKPIINNIMVALYAIVVLVFAIQAGTVIASFSDVIDAIKGGNGYTIFVAVKDIIEAGLFAFGFVNLLRGNDTPKKSGTILLGFFALEAISHTNSIFYGNSAIYFLYTLIAVVPYVIGALGAYIHFFTKAQKIIARVLVYLASAFGICVVLLNLYTLFENYTSFVNVTYVLSVLLRIAIFFVFCYQTYVLGIRRRMANEITDR